MHSTIAFLSEVVAQTNCTFAKDSLECLRAIDVDALQAANTEINASGFFGTFVFVPVVDGTFITARPTELLQQRKTNVIWRHSCSPSVFFVLMGSFYYSEGDPIYYESFRRTSFVDQSTSDTVQVPEYNSQLFPNIELDAIKTASALYAGLGTNIFQVTAIMGESPYFLRDLVLVNEAIGSDAFKGEFAIPPGTHGMDVGYYFPSQDPGGAPSFDNPDFIKAFSASFLNFAMSLNPNVKWDPTNITPLWKAWAGSNEMLFNKTEANAPDIRPITTSSLLLQRCNFWESVAAQTAQ